MLNTVVFTVTWEAFDLTEALEIDGNTVRINLPDNY